MVNFDTKLYGFAVAKRNKCHRIYFLTFVEVLRLFLPDISIRLTI